MRLRIIFRSVFHGDCPKLDPEAAERGATDRGCLPVISVDHINASELRRAVRRLKVSSAYGPDAIPAFILKDCLSVLVKPLLFVFNLSLQHGVYPTLWKVSRVTPVPKSGSSTDVTNFRPIAVLPVFGKVFESVLNNSISKQVSGLLDNSQHGFRPARSTLTNHICFADYLKTKMTNGTQVDTAYFDFRKAFDLVHNDILLMKFASLGFGPQLLRFLADYLKDRRQFVKLNGYQSPEYFTRSGVSQGSTLGPPQFLIMINDLPRVLTAAKCLMFADDLKLFLPVTGPEDCLAFQRDIDAVFDWSVRNKLPLNMSKCSVITFSRSRTPIITTYKLADESLERISTVRDLGLTLDSGFNFHEHIKEVCRDANKALGFVIRTSSQFRSVRVVRLLYNAYVRSKLEYNAVIWDPPEKLYTLMVERIQRKFCRYVYKLVYGYYPFLYPSLFVSGMIGLDTLQLRRKLMHIMHYLLLINNKIDNPSAREHIYLYVPQQYMRGVGRRRHQLLACPPTWRSRQFNNSPTARAIALINSYLDSSPDADIFVDNINTLRKNVLLFLGNL